MAGRCVFCNEHSYTLDLHEGFHDYTWLFLRKCKCLLVDRCMYSFDSRTFVFFRLQSIEEDTALICLSLSVAIFACIISSFSLEIVSMF